MQLRLQDWILLHEHPSGSFTAAPRYKYTMSQMDRQKEWHLHEPEPVPGPHAGGRRRGWHWTWHESVGFDEPMKSMGAGVLLSEVELELTTWTIPNSPVGHAQIGQLADVPGRGLRYTVEWWRRSNHQRSASIGHLMPSFCQLADGRQRAGQQSQNIGRERGKEETFGRGHGSLAVLRSPLSGSRWVSDRKRTGTEATNVVSCRVSAGGAGWRSATVV